MSLVNSFYLETFLNLSSLKIFLLQKLKIVLDLSKSHEINLNKFCKVARHLLCLRSFKILKTSG